MNILKEDLNRELNSLKEKIHTSKLLSEEDLKIILLSVLDEEDLNEDN
jgi:hypothetical protein